MDYRREFLDLLLKKNALKIAGDPSAFFQLKSGRASPSFISLGSLTDGASLITLKKCYSQAALEGVERGVLHDFAYVFGPAYKGITLGALLCEGLQEYAHKSTSLLYDRKEEKAHGEVSQGHSVEKIIVGAENFVPASGILLVDDVVTTGKAKYEALEKIRLLGEHQIAGMVVAVDRQELLGDAQQVGQYSAIQALEHELGIRTFAILTMQEIFSLVKDSLSAEVRQAWIAYYERYGAVQLG